MKSSGISAQKLCQVRPYHVWTAQNGKLTKTSDRELFDLVFEQYPRGFSKFRLQKWKVRKILHKSYGLGIPTRKQHREPRERGIVLELSKVRGQPGHSFSWSSLRKLHNNVLPLIGEGLSHKGVFLIIFRAAGGAPKWRNFEDFRWFWALPTKNFAGDP